MTYIIDPNKQANRGFDGLVDANGIRASIAARQALESPTEPADALNEAVRTHPSSEDIKRISELLMAVARKCQNSPKDLHKFRKILEKFDDRLTDKTDTAPSSETGSGE